MKKVEKIKIKRKMFNKSMIQVSKLRRKKTRPLIMFE